MPTHKVRSADPRNDASPALKPGDWLGGYRIERLIGRGAMGAVHAAVDANGHALALKTLALVAEFEGVNLDAARERFTREAQAAARLRHPDIVAIYASGEERGIGYIAMELATGCDLTRYARPARLLPEPLVLNLVARVAEALDQAHRAGIVHRDIKPANVMVDLPLDRVKITDFGVARLADAARSRSGLVLGTPAFMSPEQLAGGTLDGRSDLYSLGVLLFQLLTGALPYPAGSLGQLLQHIAGSPPRSLSQVRPDLPVALDELVALSLQKLPARRVQTGQALAAHLRQISAEWKAGSLA